jgi:hypothetical protein
MSQIDSILGENPEKMPQVEAILGESPEKMPQVEAILGLPRQNSLTEKKFKLFI